MGEQVVYPRRWSNFIFATLFAVSLLLFGRILLPFMMPVLLGAFLVVLFQPMQAFFQRHLGPRPAAVSVASTTGVFLLILVPLAVIGYLVARELLAVMAFSRELLEEVDLRTELINQLPRAFRRYLPAHPQNSDFEQGLMGAMAGGANLVTSVLSAGTDFAVNVFLMLVSMYYFFLDGRRLMNDVLKLLPMDRRYSDAFIREFKDVAYAIMYGNTLTALVQAAVGLVGLYLAGVPHAPVWAVAMMVVAMVPVGGTALVWGPISIALMVTGKINEGLFLMAWGAFLVSTVDNVIRPRLCGSRMRLHPLLVFLSMFGGLAVFGMMGLLVGPLIASIFMAMVRIWRRDFLGPMVTGPMPALQPADSQPALAPVLGPVVLQPQA